MVSAPLLILEHLPASLKCTHSNEANPVIVDLEETYHQP
jgi:hypothetical protein